MPVPTLVTDLSTTLASNSPSGSDNVFPDLDNYLRALSGFVASIRDNSGNGWVSPYLPLTYSAGTANGVVYLDGSKVVTTGSALVFDGTNFSTTGTASATKLIPTGGSATGNGMYLPAANTLGFSTNNTERARITSGGDLLVGTTTIPSSSNAGFVIAKDADGTYLRNACTITTTRTHFEFVNGNGTVGTISTNASATAYNTSSDRRLKENIAPAADAGPVIDAIEIVQHDWKVGGHTRFGVIAQDLNAVAPEAVSAGDDGDEIEKTWGVDYSKLVPMLIKEIQSLRARVAALEQA